MKFRLVSSRTLHLVTCLRPSLVALLLGTALLSLVPPAWSQSTFPYTVLYKFKPGGDGEANGYAYGNLALDSTGSILGAAINEGNSYGSCLSACGLVFKLAHGRLTDIDAFIGFQPHPYIPSSGLLRDKAGNLYGETQSGGSAGFGAVYTIDPNGNEIVLYSFSQEGSYPTGGLIQDTAGNLLGVSTGYCNPGAGCGDIFKIDLKGNETVLYTFPAGGQAGSNPSSALVEDKAGNLYGTTPFGGPYETPNNQELGYGVLYKLSPDGSETVLHNFTGGADGANPAGLTQDGQGNLIGYATMGGSTAGNCAGLTSGCGVIFKYDTHGNFSILHTFSYTDGSAPQGVPLLINGSIYGATFGGGYDAIEACAGGCGLAFRLSPSGVETVLHTFIHSDGNNPNIGLVTDGKGNLFGGTYSGFLYRVTLP